ncbi:MAG: sulfite exporter TauE/SafE family protein [Hyphomicrobium sp.]|nr:sulfite exporter TauE/SafE family protein [Hyphomicrobium sp.]
MPFHDASIVVGVFFAGASLGLASALHCAAMCGCIGAALLLGFDPTRRRSRLSLLMEMQAGRVATYVALGALVGLVGSAGYAWVAPADHFRVIRTAAAVSIVAVGLWTAGLLPIPERATVVARALLPVFNRWTTSPARAHSIAPFGAGLLWGANPCPMVLAALFSAALTGTAGYGALLMAGFGLGTVPAVVGSAMGLSRLSCFRGGVWGPVAGLTISGAGVLAAFGGWDRISAYCVGL